MTNHLVMPDAHAFKGDTFERFYMAGEFALDKRPDVIINLGDLYDMPSLCSYDKGKRGFEGRRYWQDTQAGRDALDAFWQPIRLYNERQKRNKKPQYKPRKVFLLGNHENRINRAVDDDAKLEGTIGIKDLGLRERGWEVHDFLVPVEIDGVNYNHYFVSGVMGYPIGGVNPARSVIAKHMASCTAGHSHTFDFAMATGPQGNRAYGLIAGCYFDHHMDFAAATEHMWWRGLVYKTDVKNGEYDLNTYSLERLRSGNW